MRARGFGGLARGGARGGAPIDASRRLGAARTRRAGCRAGAGGAAGTAVHRALEALRLDADLRADLGAAGRAAAWIAAQAATTRLRRARARSRCVERFADGPLARALAALRDHVVARELPGVAPGRAAEGDGPVGFVAGAIDLLYRDPATDELVVADYKTDRVEGEAALAERAALYAGPGGALSARGAGGARAARSRRASSCGSCMRARSFPSVDTRASPTLACIFPTSRRARGGAS